MTALAGVPGRLIHEVEAEMVELPGINHVGESVTARLRESFQIGHRNRKPTEIMRRSDDGQHPQDALNNHCRAPWGDSFLKLCHERFDALGSGAGLRRSRRVKLRIPRQVGEPLAISLLDNATALGTPRSCWPQSR
jgi:hypothetical protein